MKCSNKLIHKNRHFVEFYQWIWAWYSCLKIKIEPETMNNNHIKQGYDYSRFYSTLLCEFQNIWSLRANQWRGIQLLRDKQMFKCVLRKYWWRTTRYLGISFTLPWFDSTVDVEWSSNFEYKLYAFPLMSMTMTSFYLSVYLFTSAYIFTNLFIYFFC